MRGASRAALAACRDQLNELGSAAGDQLGDELFAVTALLDHQGTLRRALTDPAAQKEARTGLAQALLAGKVSDAAADLVKGAAGQRWSAPGDLADALEELAVTALVIAADEAGKLDDLEDELFRFGRIVTANPGLRLALSSPYLAADRKQEVLDALLTRKVTPQTRRLVEQASTAPRGRSLDANLAQFAALAARRRERLVAEVHVATALPPERRRRLAAALAAIYDHDVHLNVVIDPQVLGGISVQVGEELIDGSTASRLAELRRKMAA